jgi:type I restriction enzyme R subunit/putative DNA methylase
MPSWSLAFPGKHQIVAILQPHFRLDMNMGSAGAFKGWCSRGYLPHCDSGDTIQFVTFRLADSLPQEKLSTLDRELAHIPTIEAEKKRRKAIEQWLDAGMGSCALAHPFISQLVQNALFRFDGDRYRLIAWCIMPNHVHVLIEPMIPLSLIVQSWKSYTGREGRKIATELDIPVPCVDVSGSGMERFWMRDYWDRFIRNEKHFQQTIRYIHENPVKAGLCDIPEQWRGSSAYVGESHDFS